MKQSIGFIAIGQAGGNIGKAFERYGYTVLFLNTSQEDLDTLNDTKFKRHIKGGEGCNKDRNKAKELVIKDFENIFTDINDKLREEVIYVIFSSGGGTGSGASPMLMDLLSQQMHDKIIGAITILPAISEPLKAHINAYECFQEMEKIDSITSVFVLDNDKQDRMSINSTFVQLFNSMTTIPNYKDIRGNIDKAEMKEMLKSRGCIIITKLNANNTSTVKLLESFHNNIFAPLEGDKVVKYVGLSSANRIDTEDIKKEIGVYLDLFQNYNKDSTICLLCGLSMPITRLKAIRDKVMENKSAVQKNIQEVKESKLTECINFLDDREKANRVVSDAKDIFSKYRKKE